MKPRLDLVRHLALYTAFHRSRANRALHFVGVPLVLFTMMCMVAYLRIPTDHPMACVAHVATPISLAMVFVLATVDRAGATVLLAALLPACALAGALADVAAWWIVVPAAALLHIASWWGMVVFGHGRIEPDVDVDGRRLDSNVYFRRSYYITREVGSETRSIDALVQFCIAPLSVVQDALVTLGLRRGLERAVIDERQRLLRRLAEGAPPLAQR